MTPPQTSPTSSSAQLVKLADVCRRLNVDRKTVYKLIEAKLLPCSRIPGVGRRFERADVEALIQQYRHP